MYCERQDLHVLPHSCPSRRSSDLVTWEYYRCCLLRTLMSYEGVPTDEGGADIFPDLAAGEPTVSDDGLTTTFQIKPGLMYAPPKDDRSEEHTSELQSLMRISYAVFCLKKKTQH